MPDLHQIARGQLPHDFALAEVIRGHDSVVLVGHSGAGPLLPLAVAQCDLTSVRYVFVDAAVPPADWDRAPAGFVLLSETYRPFALTAAEKGWPLVEVLGTHLELVNEPERVAAAIVSAMSATA